MITEQTLIIAGLGNHRPALLGTRHNAGYDAVNRIRTAAWTETPTSWFSPLKDNIVLAAPCGGTLNTSGEDLIAVTGQHPHLIVVIDDMDLPVGRWRLALKGSDAGHRGLRDIQQRWDRQIPRLRIGIGRPATGTSVSEHVLGQPSDEERAAINQASTEGMQHLLSRTDELRAAPHLTLPTISAQVNG